jgi:hypothetical protein
MATAPAGMTGDPNLIPYDKEDIAELLRNMQKSSKTFSIERDPTKALVSLAQTFVEEILDLNHNDKKDVSTNAISKLISFKFP